MGLKHMIKDNAWNETHAKNRKLMEKNGLATYLTNDFGFIKYATTKDINLRKDEITQEFIDEFLAQREATNIPVQNTNSDIEVIDENFAPTETTNTPIQNNKIQEIKEKFEEGNELILTDVTDLDITDAEGVMNFVKEAKPVNKFDIKEIQEIFDIHYVLL